jgi:hypothetical protein
MNEYTENVSVVSKEEKDFQPKAIQKYSNPRKNK